MPATLRHFAINAEDNARARAFYKAVFDWEFTAWGPPGFFQTKDAGAAMLGAIQDRQPQAPRGFVTTFGVDDIQAALRAVEANGGRVVMPPYRIDGVGDIGYFEDSEGNLCGIAQYVAGMWD